MTNSNTEFDQNPTPQISEEVSVKVVSELDHNASSADVAACVLADGTDRDALSDLEKIGIWLAFSASVIKSGETWTPTCQRVWDDATEAYRGAIAATSEPSAAATLAYAQSLAVAAAKHYGPPPGFAPLPDLYGVLTQIDNMLTELRR